MPQYCRFTLTDLVPCLTTPLSFIIKQPSSSSELMDKKTKVLHIISSLSRGGRERQLATMYKYSDRTKLATKIIYFNEPKNDYIEEYGLRNTDLIKIKADNLFYRLFELNSIVKKINPDIIYTWGNLETFLSFIICILHKIKLINGSIRHGIRLKKLSHYFRMIMLHLSPYVVANSYAGLFANNLKRGYVLYNGIDRKFENVLDDRQKIIKRNELIGEFENKQILISVANFVSYKDYFTIIEALNQLKRKGYKFYYIVIGDGPLKNDIQKLIDKYSLTDYIKLFGVVNNVEDYLSIADIFVHSSRGEGCSNAILEAMFQGLPIIASDVGGTKEITTKDNAMLFQYKNINDLTEKLETVLSDKKLQCKMGKRSRRTAQERFTVEKMIYNYHQIIMKVMS